MTTGSQWSLKHGKYLTIKTSRMELYNNCNECPRRETKQCAFLGSPENIKPACVYRRIIMKQFHPLQSELPPGKLPSDYFPHLQWIEYGYEEFLYFAFDAATPEQQARQLQEVLVSTAAVADFRKVDITDCRFFIDGNGEGRAEMPPRIT